MEPLGNQNRPTELISAIFWSTSLGRRETWKCLRCAIGPFAVDRTLSPSVAQSRRPNPESASEGFGFRPGLPVDCAQRCRSCVVRRGNRFPHCATPIAGLRNSGRVRRVLCRSASQLGPSRRVAFRLGQVSRMRQAPPFRDRRSVCARWHSLSAPGRLIPSACLSNTWRPLRGTVEKPRSSFVAAHAPASAATRKGKLRAVPAAASSRRRP